MVPGISARATPDGAIEFSTTSPGKVSLELTLPDEPPTASLAVVEGGTRIAAACGVEGPSPRTVRWRYVLRTIDHPSTAPR